MAFIMQGTLYSGQSTRSLVFLFAEAFISFMRFLCNIMVTVITAFRFLENDGTTERIPGTWFWKLT